MCVSEFDVVIIGAGALGISAAFHLGARGRKVCVLERELTFAQHASSKNAGMFRHLYRHPQLTEWAARSVQTWPQKAKDVAFQRTGSWIVGRTPPVHHPELFASGSVMVPEGPLPAVVTEEDGLLSPYDLVHGIYQETDRSFVSYHFQREVCALRYRDSAWDVRTQAGEIYRAPWVINAAGAWINRFLKSMPQQRVEAQPYARHLFVVEGWESNFMPVADTGYYWDETDAWYMRLWEQGSRLVSICDQTPAIPEQFVPSEDIDERLAQRLIQSVPAQAQQLCLGPSWFCFRTYTEDRLPIWGEDPRCKGLFWLAAFGGFGMSTSFAASEDAARFICGESAPDLPEFSPLRVQQKA